MMSPRSNAMVGDRPCAGTGANISSFQLPASRRPLLYLRIPDPAPRIPAARSWKLGASRELEAMLRFSSSSDDVDQTRLRARLYLIAPFPGGSRRPPDSLQK